MRPAVATGSLEPMRPDPCVGGPVPPSSRTCSALLRGPPPPSARATWISKSLGRATGHISRALNACELDKVAGRVAAEESRPVGNRRVVVRLMTRLGQSLPDFVQAFDVEAEVTRGNGISLASKKVQLYTVSHREPHKIKVTQRRGRWDLGQSEDLSIKDAECCLSGFAERRRDVLQSTDPHVHRRG